MDSDDAYNNRDHIPGAADFPPRWAAEAAAFREHLSMTDRARLDIAYGATGRERFELFLPEGMALGLMVFVHGGYWRAFDKSDWSHLAAGALARGVDAVGLGGRRRERRGMNDRRLVAEGPPEHIAAVEASYTGRYLREVLI